MNVMIRLISLIAVVAIAQAAIARADEFVDIDPVRLAKNIERLADAWRIEIAVTKNATDDFADDDIFQANQSTEAPAFAGNIGDRKVKLERALLDLGTGKENAFAIHKAGQQ